MPNVVVDGSANEGTVLTLSHWPGTVVPDALRADLSAEMAFRYLDAVADGSMAPVAADAVTNNHFDQDGVVGVHVLVHPESSLAHRELLVEVARAGDFDVTHDRRAARAAMALAALAETVVAGDDPTAACYEAALPLVLPMALEPDRFRDLWGDGDAALDAGEAAIRSGVVSVVEHPAVDLAVVSGPGAVDLHPMAIHGTTACLRILAVDGRRASYRDRYETWVRLATRRPLPRVDLRPLAEHLSDLDAVVWEADGPGALTPSLRPDGETALDEAALVAAVVRHLGGAPDPSGSGASGSGARER